ASRARSVMFRPSSAGGWAHGRSGASAPNPRPGRRVWLSATKKPESYCEVPVSTLRGHGPGAGRRRGHMRKNFLFFLGSLTGVGLTLLVMGPQGEHLIARAKAAAGAADTYSQLNLFGEVFERVRSDYVEKPGDTALIEGAINGMVTALDPH